MSSGHYLANIPTESVYMYVRERGRSKGPYNWTQMQKMIASGKLNQMDELSLDNNDWKPASIYPILFNPKAPSPARNDEILEPENATYGQWYFEMDDRAFGPVPFRWLFRWTTNNWLDLPARVWTDGLEDWVEVVSIPSFFPPADDLPPDTLSNPDTDLAP